MSVPESMIDMIVREVMRQLAADRGAGDSASAEPQSGTMDSSAVSLSERVVTEETLRELGQGIRRIQLSPRSVLTPSARDYLAHKSIEVVSQIPNAVSRKAMMPLAASMSRKILVIGGDADAAEQYKVPGWKLSHDNCEKQAVSWIQKTAGADSDLRLMTVSELPSVTAFRLNRCRDCRAAVITTDCNWEAILLAMRPNIVCVSKSGISWAKRRAILRRLENKDGVGPVRVSVSSNGRGLQP